MSCKSFFAVRMHKKFCAVLFKTENKSFFEKYFCDKPIFASYIYRTQKKEADAYAPVFPKSNKAVI